MSVVPPTSADGGRPPAGPSEPIRRAVACNWSPAQVALALRERPHGFALIGSWFGGGAVIGTDPATVVDASSGRDPFDLLDAVAGSAPAAAMGAAGAVLGGWVGYLGYQAGSLVERLPGSPPRPHPLPDWWLGWYDHILRFEPATGWWFEALATPDRERTIESAHQRILERLAGEPPMPRGVEIGPFSPTPTGEDHRKAVRRTLELISAGDIYQANVCLRLSARRLQGEPLDLLAVALEQLSPGFAAHIDLGRSRAVTSLSPERFLTRQGDLVTTSPIKGTRQRDPTAGPSDPARQALLASAKDRAENVMIVDLMRNDLGRVCVPGSIEVPRLLDVEAHPGLWHLVSEVTGRLRDGVGDGGLLRASFPPGSVTGAPKVRAMEVIAEVEATGREIYTGSIGMVSPAAGADWNVAIRTFEHCGAHIWLGVGGGIVAESDPEAELAEAMTKASPLVEALGTSIDAGSPRDPG